MARNKQTARKTTGGETSSTQTTRRNDSMKHSQLPPTRPHRFRPSAVVLHRIRPYKKTTELLIKKLPFQRVVKEIAQNYKADIRFQSTALLALQEATEAVFCRIIVEDANHAASHGKRVTVRPKDLALTIRLRGDRL
ncbi:histone 3 [Mycena olivaceomarginata]|nr:histone 3 [Mycena olivaceomarginata]